MRDVIEI